jgi:nitrile hydratase accessory protein
MSEIPDPTLVPIARPSDDDKNRPVFAEPWHAQLFALTVGLSEAGHFTWPEWAETFSAGLERARASGTWDDDSRYYGIWLECLEAFLDQRGLAAREGLAVLKQAWTEAYLATPHGQPVKLKR